jgi:hypothetical protein
MQYPLHLAPRVRASSCADACRPGSVNAHDATTGLIGCASRRRRATLFARTYRRASSAPLSALVPAAIRSRVVKFPASSIRPRGWTTRPAARVPSSPGSPVRSCGGPAAGWACLQDTADMRQARLINHRPPRSRPAGATRPPPSRQAQADHRPGRYPLLLPDHRCAVAAPPPRQARQPVGPRS